MDLDLVKLRTLVEVRAAGSMTAAAAALGYTTGAVSQQMAALQRSVRTELFTQVGRRVQLTDAVTCSPTTRWVCSRRHGRPSRHWRVCPVARGRVSSSGS